MRGLCARQQRGQDQQHEQPIRWLIGAWAGLKSMKPSHWLRTQQQLKVHSGHSTEFKSTKSSTEQVLRLPKLERFTSHLGEKLLIIAETF